MKVRNSQIQLFLLILANMIFGQSQITTSKNYRFQKIGIEQGLSQSSILAITQDKRGYMWFGTATGLNRYDGYEFVVYTHDFNDSLSISDNEITSLYEDDEGFLWVGTTEGILNKFDPKTETFLHFDIANSSDWYSTVEEELYDYPITFSRNQSSTITSITQDKFGNLWIGTWGKGIVRLNPETNNRKYYYYFKHRANSLSSNKIVKILNDNENNLWIGTFGGGLNRISFDSKNADQVIIDIFKHDSGFLFGKRITSLFEDFDGKIWIGSYAGGVSVIPSNQKMQSPKAIQYQLLNNEFKSLSGDKILNIMSIIEDFNSKIWVGTYGDGLYSYSKQTKETNHFVAESSDPNSLSENEIQSLFVDNSGILWIGTQLGSGINKYEVNINNFKTIPVLTEKNKSLNDNIVWAVHEDKENNIWIGTHRGGLNKWDKEKNEYTYFTNQQNLPDNHIRAITEDKKGNLWIGTYSGGLSYFNKEKSTFKNFTKNDNSNSLNAVQIQSFYNDNDSVLWIGTFGGGLNRLDLKKFYTSGIADFKSYMHNPAESNSISDDRVYIIFKDSQNIFWIGTHGGGLNKFDPKNETFTNFKSSSEIKYSLTDNRIMSIQEAHDGKLLIGTFGGGIDIFDKETLKFENLSKKLALNCSDVYGILMDNDYEYWLSTDNGIFKIDSEFRSFRQYDISDGLQSLEFSGGAYLKGHDGIFYFGGINGINFFDPQKIRIDNYIPPIVISRIKVFDKPIRGEPSILVFGRDQNYFSFEFASLDYKNSNRNKYKFILEGLDTKWAYTDANDRRVYYTNLNPGQYKFRVQGTNNDGIWSPFEANVEITILAPFWMQWWFISLLILLVGGIITFFINQRFRYLVALDKLKSNIAADLHDNVGAGLTEISILSDLAVNEIEKPKIATKHLGQISTLSRELVESMSDIVWVVNPNRDSLYDLIVRIKDTYGELLADMGIKLSTSNLENMNEIKLPMDYRQNLYLILKETINNSIKHSKCNLITIDINQNKNGLIVKVQDDGIGFDINKKTNGNGLSNIIERARKIKARLNIKSQNGKGTLTEFQGKL